MESHLIQDIDKIESVQCKFTKFLPGIFHMSYVDRLAVLMLESLELRRIKADLIFLYKMIHGLVDINCLDCFSFKTTLWEHDAIN